MNRQSLPDIQTLRDFRLPLTRRSFFVLLGVAAVGAVSAVGNALLQTGGGRRLMLSYLVAFAFVLSISLGCMFFVLIQHLTRAGWSVLIRRPAEVLSLNIICVAVLFLPIAWSVYRGDGEIYPWAVRDTAPSVAQQQSAASARSPVDSSNSPISAAIQPAASVRDESGRPIDTLTLNKRPYLNPRGFLSRWALLFAIWIAVAVYYYRNSISQDQRGGVGPTRRMESLAGILLVAYALTVTFGAFDLLMSLDPHWYSTIFGAYYFAGCAVGGLAALLLCVQLLTRQAALAALVTVEHRRDLGRLLFAFVFFWAYIAFSQYMLLWYANVPETTQWLVRRGMSTATGFGNTWGWLVIALLVFHFLLPFGGIMSRHVKSHSEAMIAWTILLLLVHYFDLYWLVIPQLSPGLTISFVEIGTAAAVVSIYLASAMLVASRCALVPVGDPRLAESMRLQESY